MRWPTYDNVGPNAIGDCEFAAAADWIIATKHVTPPEAEVIGDFYAAGGTPEGGTDELSNWWTFHAIDGYSEQLSVAPGDIARSAIEAQTMPTITEMALPNGTSHMILTLGPTTDGVRIVTWGSESLMRWPEWEQRARINLQVDPSPN
ncbi:MAG TPA: hypothetical protein VGF95_14455 [Solirubrobacteraceae bacterium]